MSGSDATTACPRCGGVLHPDDRFCEGCGARVAAAPQVVAEVPPPPASAKQTDPELADGSATGARPCRACGGVVAVDGYCEQCGEPAASERDHWSQSPARWVGGVCDRGVRHARNEDAMALAASGTYAVLVVCDGVSTAPDSDVASLAAVTAARDVLLAGGPDGVERATGSSAARTMRAP